METLEFRNPFTNGRLVGAGIDSDAYHRQVEGVTRGNPNYVLSRSELMLFDRNPQNWLAGYRPKDTDATDWGNLIDCLVTARERFDTKFALAPETCTATKTMGIVKEGRAAAGDQVPWNPQAGECKEWKKEQEANGLICLSAEDMLDATSAVARLMKDPVAGPFIKCCAFQVMCVAEYHDSETGLVIPIKTLIDLVPDKGHPHFGRSLGDFKTARNASPDEWTKVVPNRHYDVQAAINTWVYQSAHPQEDRCDFRHIILESDPPYQPARRILAAEVVKKGQAKLIGALRFYAQCLSTGVYPTWDDLGDRNHGGWLYTDLPEWEKRQKTF